MNNPINNKPILLSVVIAGFAWALLGHGVSATIAGVLGLLALLRWLRRMEGERNWNAVQGALVGYEEIIAGLLWSGKDAEILASDRVDDPREAGPVCFEHICRTKNGSWFLFFVAVTQGRIVDRSLKPCDEATAKRRLERHQDIYVRCFGQPTTA